MRVLAVGAHPDDIELGCGGALLAHRARGDEITLLVMTTGEEGPQDARSRIREQEDAAALLGATLLWGGFPDGGGAQRPVRGQRRAARDGRQRGRHRLRAHRRRHPPGPPAHLGRGAGRGPAGPAGAAVRVADLGALRAVGLPGHRRLRRGQDRPAAGAHVAGAQERPGRPGGARGAGPLPRLPGPGAARRGVRDRALPAGPRGRAGHRAGRPAPRPRSSSAVSADPTLGRPAPGGSPLGAARPCSAPCSACWPRSACGPRSAR